ncbi:hypothetical protein BD410DRAFT_783790 [Rickenella mellea]|uniref:Uncharacterized protein n=1 Tax=Rickenella mellea TaxID=50990 RepID=A0A4Y7QIG4_9AGAM|nr:hypothetical protein BD410DRAFT_783790 [Rickenella mellea]
MPVAFADIEFTCSIPGGFQPDNLRRKADTGNGSVSTDESAPKRRPMRRSKPCKDDAQFELTTQATIWEELENRRLRDDPPEVNRVLCDKCGKWIKLSKSTKYKKAAWARHRSLVHGG